MKRCSVLLALILATACTTLGQQAAVDTSASREDIRKLFDVMHIRDQMKQVMDQVMKQMKSMNHEQIKKHDPQVTDARDGRLLFQLDRAEDSGGDAQDDGRRSAGDAAKDAKDDGGGFRKDGENSAGGGDKTEG
jgi:hypothetical protein